MQNIIIYMIVLLLGIAVIAVNLAFFLGIPAIIIWKIYRRIRYRISIFN